MPAIFADTVNLFNRTKRVLMVTFDGFHTYLQPGDNPGFPAVAIEFAKNQNPIMGTEHPYDPMDFKSLVGIKGNDKLAKEWGLTDCSPIDNDPKDVQRVDRKKVVGRYSAKNVATVEAGGVTAFEARTPVSGSSSVAEFGKS